MSALSAPMVYADAESRQIAFRKATDPLLFTKDFNTALEAWRDDPIETPAARFLAWAKRSAWGRYSLYCVNDDGTPAYQVKAAEELALDKRRVSATVDYLVKRGFLGRDGKVLYPVISPVLADNPFRSDPKSGEYGLFLEQWKVSHSADFEELEVARSTVKRLEKVKLSLYKEWRASRTNSAPSLLEEEEEFKEQTPTPSQPVSSAPQSVPKQEKPAGRLVEVVSENGSSKPTETLKPGDTITIPVVNAVNPPGPDEVRGEVRAYMESIVRPGLTPEIVDEIAGHINTPELLEAFKWESQPARTQHAKTWKYWVRIAERVAADAPRLAAAKANEGNGYSPPEPKSRSETLKREFLREIEAEAKARGR